MDRQTLYIEDIYFFDVNTKCISSSVLKISDFSRVRSTSKISVLNSRDEMYLVFKRKTKVSFYFIFFTMSHPLKNDVLKMKYEKKK